MNFFLFFQKKISKMFFFQNKKFSIFVQKFCFKKKEFKIFTSALLIISSQRHEMRKSRKKERRNWSDWSADQLIWLISWFLDFFLKNWICWNFEYFLKFSEILIFFLKFYIFLKFSEILKFNATFLPLPKYCQLIFQTNAWLAWAEVLSIDLSDKYLIGLSQSIVSWSFRQIHDCQ